MPTYSNINGTWRNGNTTWSNINGVWRTGQTYSNINGTWRAPGNNAVMQWTSQSTQAPAYGFWIRFSNNGVTTYGKGDDVGYSSYVSGTMTIVNFPEDWNRTSIPVTIVYSASGDYPFTFTASIFNSFTISMSRNGETNVTTNRNVDFTNPANRTIFARMSGRFYQDDDRGGSITINSLTIDGKIMSFATPAVSGVWG